MDVDALDDFSGPLAPGLHGVAWYVVAAASCRLSTDGFHLDAVAMIVVVTVLLVAFARNRVPAAVDREAD